MPSNRRHVLATIRHEIGLTQKELAKILGVALVSVQRIEQLSLALSEELARRIEAQLGVSASWLLANDAEIEPLTPRNSKWTKEHYELAQGSRVFVAERFGSGKSAAMAAILGKCDASDELTNLRGAQITSRVNALLAGSKGLPRQGILVYRLMRALDKLEEDFRPDPKVWASYLSEKDEHLKAFMAKAENLCKDEQADIWGPGLIATVKTFSTKKRTAKREPRSRDAFSQAVSYLYEYIRSARAMDQYALKGWIARVMTQSEKKDLPRYVPGTVNLPFMTEVAKRSRLEHGPLAAQHYLAERGISLVIEPQLPKTYLDGAALLLSANKPVIGLTLRHDRLDKFWFTLFHELAHISLHSDERADFIDDLDEDAETDPKEREADELAGEALIPERDWVKSPASKMHSSRAAEDLAKQLGIHPAIVAGKMRRKSKADRLLNHLIGYKEVRREFSEIEWPTK